VVDFQAPLTHSFVQDNAKRKGRFEKMFLEGRPPVGVGITSGGDVFGGTQVAFTDVLGDQQFTLFASSVAQYRTIQGMWINLERRLNLAAQGYSQTQFFFGQLANVFYDPMFSGIIDRDLAVATRTTNGGTAYAIYPFNRYRRVELYGGVNYFSESFADQGLQQYSQEYQATQFGRQLFNNGLMVPVGAGFIQEITIFREFGPLTGSTMRVAYEIAPKIGNTLTRQTVDVDVRKYFRLAGTALLAVRGRGFTSWGDNPGFTFFGGNNELRGYNYLEFAGQDAFFVNAELRLPLINAMATPIGILGGVRATLFANLGAARWRTAGQPFQVVTRNTTLETPVLGYNNLGQPIYGPPVPVSGFRLKDGRGSYGFGLMSFALGFPVHFDWTFRTLMNPLWEDVAYAAIGGSREFRRSRFQLWVGFDF